MTTTNTWLTIIPVIPLARSVAVVDRETGNTGIVQFVSDSGYPTVLWDGTDTPEIETPEGIVPDLNDAQGYGHALVWWFREAQKEWTQERSVLHVHLIYRYMFGPITDDDKYRLAAGLPDLTSP